MTQTVVFDTEAVDALGDPRHRHHRQVIALAKVVAGRKRKASAIRLVVPTTVRVEAGWDRTAPVAAARNRLRIADLALDPAAASAAAAIRSRHGVSVADAHIGAVIGQLEGDVTVVTSDPRDLRAVAGDRAVTVLVL